MRKKINSGTVLGVLVAAAGLAPAGSWAGTVETAPFGTTKDGKAVQVFTLTNNHGMKAKVLDLGAIICDVEAPGRDGKMANVVLCQKDLANLEATGPLSALTGRYANRIAHGFTLDGKHIDLKMDRNGVTLHGGPPFYPTRVLQTVGTFKTATTAGVTLRLVSPDGDQGFPGTLTIDVTYTLTDSNDFRMDYKATTDKPTVLNLTNHTYYNMAGWGSAEPQILTVMADQITPTDAFKVPTGELMPVAGTAFDFRTPKPVGRDIRSTEPQMLLGAPGYDHNFVLRKSKPGALELAARLTDPASGRTLELSTTEPGVPVYSAMGLRGDAINAMGVTMRSGDAVALETQHFPDSPNEPKFPSTVLRPGETFHSTTLMHFTVE
jgi:aldose 1-epimerase